MALTSLAGTAQNTLTGMEARTIVEGAMAEEQERLQQQANQAAAAQQQAQQQLLQASQAPLDVNALSQAIPLLLGNIASVIGQDKSFVERGRQQARDERVQAMQARRENLDALSLNYREQANAARQAGDLLAEAQMRVKLESASKQADLMRQQMQQDFEKQFNETPAQRKDREMAVAGVRASASSADDVPDADIPKIAESLSMNQGKPSDLRKETWERVQVYMRDNNIKITPAPARKAIDELSAAEAAIAELKGLSEQVNTAQAGPGRFVQAGKSMVKGWLQNSTADAVYDSVRGGLAGNFARAIQAERGVLTNQDRQFALSLVPKRTDTAEVARDKIARLERFIIYKRESAMKAYTTAFGNDPATPERTNPTKRNVRVAKVLPSIREQALNIALSDDPEKLTKIAAMIKQYPALDQDEDLEGILNSDAEANMEAIQGSQPQ